MAAYAPPHSTSYSNGAYAGPPPQVQVQQAPLQQPPYQRDRGYSNGSYDGRQHAQQLTPYAASPAAAPYGSPALAPNGQAYFPPMPPAHSTAALVPAAAQQLHPQEAYAVAAAGDPYAARTRTSSNASHHSHRSHHSAASHHSHHSKASSRHSAAGDEDRRRPGERATLGDTLMGMWRVLRDMIPTEKR